MSDEGPESLVLRLMRRMDEKLDRVIEDLRDVKVRLSAVERGNAELHVGLASVQTRIDRMENRLDRIERRLDLVEPAPR